jgi:hypothetical protein
VDGDAVVALMAGSGVVFGAELDEADDSAGGGWGDVRGCLEGRDEGTYTEKCWVMLHGYLHLLDWVRSLLRTIAVLVCERVKKVVFREVL